MTSAAGRNAYSATKSALIGLARASAIDLGGDGITVNCLAPGPFLTDLPVSLLTEEQKADFAEQTALGRWGKPEELVGPALLAGQRRGQLHHRRHAGRRRRRLGEGFLTQKPRITIAPTHDGGGAGS